MSRTESLPFENLQVGIVFVASLHLFGFNWPIIKFNIATFHIAHFLSIFANDATNENSVRDVLGKGTVTLTTPQWSENSK